jgi:hypothetical protein
MQQFDRFQIQGTFKQWNKAAVDGFTLKSRAAQNTSMRINRLLSITYPAKFEASSHDRRRWA